MSWGKKICFTLIFEPLPKITLRCTRFIEEVFRYLTSLVSFVNVQMTINRRLHRIDVLQNVLGIDQIRNFRWIFRFMWTANQCLRYFSKLWVQWTTRGKQNMLPNFHVHLGKTCANRNTDPFPSIAAISQAKEIEFSRKVCCFLTASGSWLAHDDLNMTIEFPLSNHADSQNVRSFHDKNKSFKCWQLYQWQYDFNRIERGSPLTMSNTIDTIAGWELKRKSTPKIHSMAQFLSASRVEY